MPHASDSGDLLSSSSDLNIGPMMTRPSHLASLIPKKGRPHLSTVQTDTTRPEASVNSNFAARCADTASSGGAGLLSLWPKTPPATPNKNAATQIVSVFNVHAFRCCQLLSVNRHQH